MLLIYRKTIRLLFFVVVVDYSQITCIIEYFKLKKQHKYISGQYS